MNAAGEDNEAILLPIQTVDQRSQQELAVLIGCDPVKFTKRGHSTNISIYHDEDDTESVLLPTNQLEAESQLFSASYLIGAANLLDQSKLWKSCKIVLCKFPVVTVVLGLLFGFCWYFPSTQKALEVDVSNFFHIYPILTYAFPHLDNSHLLGNIIFLILYAFAIEIVCGKLLLIGLTTLSAIGGSLVFLIVANTQPLIGSSAIVYGYLTFALISLTWEFYKTHSWKSAIGLAVTALILFFGLSPLVARTFKEISEDGVADSAHLGGALFGLPFVAISMTDPANARYGGLAVLLALLAAAAIAATAMNWNPGSDSRNHTLPGNVKKLNFMI